MLLMLFLGPWFDEFIFFLIGWSDGLTLLDAPHSVALSDFSSSPSLKLEEGVYTIDDHGEKTEKRSGSPGFVVASPSGAGGRSCQIEETPSSAVSHLHHDPGDKVELFDDVEKVEGEQNSSNPKTTHGAEIEPIGPRVVIVFRNHDANEAQYIQQHSGDLQHAGYSPNIGRIEADIGCDGSGRRCRRLRRHVGDNG